MQPTPSPQRYRIKTSHELCVHFPRSCYVRTLFFVCCARESFARRTRSIFYHNFTRMTNRTRVPLRFNLRSQHNVNVTQISVNARRPNGLVGCRSLAKTRTHTNSQRTSGASVRPTPNRPVGWVRAFNALVLAFGICLQSRTRVPPIPFESPCLVSFVLLTFLFCFSNYLLYTYIDSIRK